MKAVFWASLLFLLYTYFGYPLVLCAIQRLSRRPQATADRLPRITVLIAAYNEEKDIGGKIENTLGLDYPEDRMEIVVVSDGSTDGTDDIVHRHPSPRVFLVRTPGRKGKTGAQNIAVGKSNGEVIVFSDATTIYAKDALQKIVQAFGDPDVGGAEGRLIYLKSDTGYLGNKDLLKSYEAWIKSMESRISGGVGDNGAFYAIRRELCRPLRDDLTSDFAAPLDVSRQGKRFVFVPEALSYEKASPTTGDEYRRKVRTVRAGVNVFLHSLDLLNPVRHPWTAFVLFSRKFCRWFSSLLLLPLFLANIFLVSGPAFYGVILAMQAVFYLLALAGILGGDRLDKIRVLSIPTNFLLVNLAAVRGIAAGIAGSGSEIWTPQRA